MQPARLIGKTVDKYRVLSLLGEGGMGAVYVVEHQTIGRRAALKVLRPDLAAQPDVVERFLNEARATNRINHGGIVDIYDSGQAPEVGTYLVMELLAGESLERCCRPDSRLPLAEVVDVVSQIADALAAAHGCGIVHRDLKPANIFLVADEDHAGRRKVKILDFGIAKLLGGGGPQTRTGSLIGTPAYMSPEQCHGARAVDHRTDIYALGAIIFELLAGRPPFIAEGYGQLIAMHLTKPPPSLRQLVAGLPAAAEHVVLQALAKSPDERYQSMAALANALGNAAGVAAISPTLPSTREHAVFPELGPTLPATPIAATPIAPVPPPAVSASTTSDQPRVSTPAPSVPGRGQRPNWVHGLAGAIALLLVAGGVVAYLQLRDRATLHEQAAMLLPGDAAEVKRPASDGGPAESVDGESVDGAVGHARQAKVREGIAAPPVGPCSAASWTASSTAPVLRRGIVRRSRKLIVGFSLDQVISGPSRAGRGGRSSAIAGALRGCSDSPTRRFAQPGRTFDDPPSGLRIEIVEVVPAGKTGRGWPGVRCSYRITDPADPRLHVLLGANDVPPHNELVTLIRQGQRVFAGLQFNGYAREVGGKGNRVLGLDLCSHRVVWRSRDMAANGPLLLFGDHLISSYGFTAEPDWLYLLDAGTGKIASRQRLPKAADELRLAGDQLYVRIYDGYLTFRLSQ